jgi:hypothetical protein
MSFETTRCRKGIQECGAKTKGTAIKGKNMKVLHSERRTRTPWTSNENPKTCYVAYLSLILLDVSLQPLNLLFVIFTQQVRNMEETQLKESWDQKATLNDDTISSFFRVKLAGIASLDHIGRKHKMTRIIHTTTTFSGRYI